MAKEHVGRTKATATKTLYAVMKEMSRCGGSMCFSNKCCISPQRAASVNV